MWMNDITVASQAVLEWLGPSQWLMTVSKISPISGGIAFIFTSGAIIRWLSATEEVSGWYGDWDNWRSECGWETDCAKWKERRWG